MHGNMNIEFSKLN